MVHIKLPCTMRDSADAVPLIEAIGCSIEAELKPAQMELPGVKPAVAAAVQDSARKASKPALVQ